MDEVWTNMMPCVVSVLVAETIMNTCAVYDITHLFVKLVLPTADVFLHLNILNRSRNLAGTV